MAVERYNDPARIAPYLNPDYWEQNFTDTPEPWPTRAPSDADRHYVASRLKNYVKQGTKKEPISTIDYGEDFSTEEYTPGTILVALAEHLTIRSKSRTERPMESFAYTKAPAQRSVEDEELRLEGYGYRYLAFSSINVVVHSDEPNVLVITEESMRTLPSSSYAAELAPGVRNFTVGQTYNFVTKTGETLTRVNELYVCMLGSARGIKAGKSKT